MPCSALLLVVALTSPAQCAGPSCSPFTFSQPLFLPPLVLAPPRQQPTKHAMADSTGQAWTHTDGEYLARWVAARNQELAARKPLQLERKSEHIPKAEPGPPPDSASHDATAGSHDATAGDLAHPSSSPVSRVPSRGAGAPPAILNYGVDQTKFPRVGGKGGWHGGNAGASPSHFAGDAAEKGQRLHLTVIGEKSQETVKHWREDPRFREMEAELGDRLAVQFYPPSSPMVAEVGLPDGGKPDVVIQAADGKVIYRSHADPGSEKVIGEIRKRHPGYDPAKDPSGGSGKIGEILWEWKLVIVASVMSGLLLRMEK